MFSVNKEEIVELYNGKVDDEGNKWFIGQPVKVFYDYKADGIWQLEDAAELEKWGGVFKPGDIKIVDAMATIRSLPKTVLFSAMRIRT